MERSEYMLDRSYLSTARLNLQHYILTQSVGFMLHPKIQPHITEESAIAAVATGSGIWLLNLSSSLADTTQLHGFDVDLSQVCAKEWLPQNVSMHQWNFFEEVPEGHKGKYDAVHIRFITLTIRNDPTPILRRLLSLLKPSGWLQWTELDSKTFKAWTADPSKPAPATEKMYEMLRSQMDKHTGLVPDWTSNMGSLLKSEGMHSVETHRYRKPEWAMSHWYDSFLMACDEMALRFKEADFTNSTEEAVRELHSLNRGVALSGDVVVVIGRKELQA